MTPPANTTAITERILSEEKDFVAEYKGWNVYCDETGLYTVKKDTLYWQYRGGDNHERNMEFIETIINAK